MNKISFEFKSFNMYLYNIINKFDFNDFSPEINIQKLKEKFENHFFEKEIFWKLHKKDSTNLIFFELKTYNKDPRQKIIIEFKIEEDKLNYRTYRNSPNNEFEYISFEVIWFDHEKLYSKLLKLFEKAREN